MPVERFKIRQVTGLESEVIYLNAAKKKPAEAG